MKIYLVKKTIYDYNYAKGRMLMTKKDFLKFLKSSMKGIPIEKQEIALKKFIMDR